MTTQKHIAMWSCPRSRSTALARAFEQLDCCEIFDEPFYGPYLVTHGMGHLYRQELMEQRETDYKTVIQQITGELPKGISFSFQKHMSKHVLPQFGKEWLSNLRSFFLIRDPAEIIASYSKVDPQITQHDIGMESLHDLFQAVKSLTGETPLVIDAADVVKAPKKMLKMLCSHIDVPFSETMLCWDSGLDTSQVLFGGPLSPLASTWHANLSNSNGFMPYEEKNITLPHELKQLEEECRPIYEELYHYRMRFL